MPLLLYPCDNYSWLLILQLVFDMCFWLKFRRKKYLWNKFLKIRIASNLLENGNIQFNLYVTSIDFQFLDFTCWCSDIIVYFNFVPSCIAPINVIYAQNRRVTNICTPFIFWLRDVNIFFAFHPFHTIMFWKTPNCCFQLHAFIEESWRFLGKTHKWTTYEKNPELLYSPS